MMLDEGKQMMIVDSATHSVRMLCEAVEQEMTGWVSILRPRLFIDGNRWCALYGENLQDGVAGFGDTPSLALQDFTRAMYQSLPSPQEAVKDE